MSQSDRGGGGGAPGGGRRGEAGGGEMDALLLGRTRELSSSGSGISASTWRNWRGAGLSVLVIGALCGLIVTTILLLAPPNGLGLSGRQAKGRITLDDLNSDLSRPIVANGSWVSGSSFAYLSPEGSLETVEAPSGKRLRLLDPVLIHRFGVRTWSLSPDLIHLLIQIWDGRHLIYNIQNESLTDLHQNNRTMQWAAWGPRHTQLVFVRDHDLYYSRSFATDSFRLTYSGSRRRRNARLSPFYAERVFGLAGGDTSRVGLWWAPDGQRMAYVTLDETGVEEVVIMRYTSLYPAEHRVPFPKFGKLLPYITLWVQLLTPSSSRLPAPLEIQPPPELGKDRSFYLTSVCWLNNTHLTVAWASSLLKLTFISLYDVTRTVHSVPYYTLLRQSTDPTCPFVGGLTPGPPGYLFYLGPSGYSCRQVSSIAAKSHQIVPTSLTSGDYQVERILGHDAIRRTLYLQVRPEKQHWEHRVMSLQYTGPAPQTNASSCLSCQIPSCPVPEATFSPKGAQHFVMTCRGRFFWPTVSLWRAVPLRPVQTIQKGFQRDLQVRLSQKAKPRTVYVRLTLSRGQVEIPILLPPATTSVSKANKIPLIIIFVAESDSRRPTPVDWPAYLSVYRHYACALMHPDDAKDLPLLIRELTVPGNDVGPRLAVWARGGNAFHALKNILQLTNVSRHSSGHSGRKLECLVALAPVTDWRRANAVESGRWLRGTHRSSLLDVRDSPDSHFQQIMLVHGTADEEVPVEHSLRLVIRLVQQSWLHRLVLYPDEGSSLPWGHLHKTADSFLQRCLGAHETLHSPIPTKQKA